MKSHDLIRQERRRLGLSEQAFADAVGVSRGAVQQWEREGGTAPKRTTQARVAEVLGVALADLVEGFHSSTDGEGRGEVPLLSEVEAERYTAIDNSRPRRGVSSQPMVRVNVEVRRHTFALRVRGDSMTSHSNNSFPDGSVVIVEPDLEALSGDFVIAKNELGEITFKQLVKDSGAFYLKPLNPRYPIAALGSSDIIGVVRLFSKTFR
jgi:SOS-response transcriptional repressor LexA